MSMKDKTIRIDDWAGNILFIGDYDEPQVDEVLKANRCSKCLGDGCDDCEHTGYMSDFSVSWIDEQNHIDGMNVYEYINY